MRVAVAALCGLGLFGCGSSSSDEGGGNQPEKLLVGVQGITLTQVAVYQGPKRVLMENGQAQGSNVPLVAGRPAWLRLFHQLDANYDGGPVIARMDRPNKEPVWGELPSLGPAASVEADAGSSIGFLLDGADVGETLDYTVGFYRELTVDQDNPAARWGQSVPVEGKQNKLRLVLVPYRYDFDGSGRLPNLDAAQVEVFRQRFMGMYPVSDVEITVHEPVPWPNQLSKNGQGWQGVGLNLSSLKAQENLGDHVYYYAIFNPAASLGAYCGGGCLLGVTLLNNDPPETGSAQLRIALGVGFDQQAPNTCAHEVGHAHGREHVNCGFGLDPSSIDQDYPHDPKTIGPWSWDVVNQALVDPATHTDIMGYCDNQWISDYQYGKLFTRTQNVNQPLLSFPNGPPVYDVVAVDGLGGVDFVPNVKLDRLAGGKQASVQVRGRDGKSRNQDVAFYPYDHMSGGWFFLPAGEADEVSVVVDGKTFTAKRSASR
jgi:hypothetical protein